MRDLFGSTSFIKFRVVETILSSSDAVNKLLISEEKGIEEGDYTFFDYLSNIDSYLYGIILLKVEEVNQIKTYISNYIFYLYIPLVDKDIMYLVKSRFVSEIFKLENDTSRIDESIREFINKDILRKIKDNILMKENEVMNKLNENINDELILEYLVNYYNIFKNKKYIESIYINNEKLRSSMESLFDFL